MSKRKKKKKRGGRRSLCLSLLHTARTLHKLAQEGLQEEDVAAIVPAPGQGEVGRRHGGGGWGRGAPAFFFVCGRVNGHFFDIYLSSIYMLWPFTVFFR